MDTGHILQVSKDAIRKLMRHGWNVYPLEAFGFLLGAADPPCVHAALPTSKTAHWDSHADRWNALRERRPVAGEVVSLFGHQNGQTQRAVSGRRLFGLLPLGRRTRSR